MIADQEVAKVVWAIELLNERVRGATRDEIGYLALMSAVDLDHALCRGAVNGWVVKVLVTPLAERTGVRSGDWVYELTEMGSLRAAVVNGTVTTAA